MALAGIENALRDSGVEVEYEKGWCAPKEFTKSMMEELQSIPGVDPEMVAQMMMQSMGIEFHETTKTYDIPEFVPHVEPEDPDYRADSEVLMARALEKAKEADVVIVVAGTDSSTASEGKDRESIALPGGQSERIARLLEANPNTVVVLTVMGTIGDPVLDQCHSLVLATFAGQSQGTAIANVLFGKVNPNGKLTATWYKDDSQLPHINDYGIRKADVLTQEHGRTYWYLDEEPRFPFGYGLHYTTFRYDNLRLAEKEIPNGTSLKVCVDVTNTGDRAGKETVELYVRKVVDETFGEKPGDNKPFRQLKGFEKVELAPGETKTVAIEVPLKDITFWNYFRKKMRIEPGEYVVEVGASSQDLPVSETFTIVGEWDAPLSTVYAELDRYCYAPGETGHIKVVATLEDTQRVDLKAFPPVFLSSDEEVASVDADGTVRAKKAGTALIHVQVAYEGKTVERCVPVAVR